mmetsp:Transcript_9387/g.19543  ORF Transcript_9387/g.19543 Transcript_9387/m.19543 type:complete len:1516 (+) Transcript_9387:207-4754(+)
MSSTPHDNDVILGRGRLISAHPGNVRFRHLVSQKREMYSQSRDNKFKRSVALSIVEEIESLDPPGRFLISQTGIKFAGIKEGVWVCVEKEKAIEKVLHRLREKNLGNCMKENGVQQESSGAKEGQSMLVSQNNSSANKNQVDGRSVATGDWHQLVIQSQIEQNTDLNCHSDNTSHLQANDYVSMPFEVGRSSETKVIQGSTRDDNGSGSCRINLSKTSKEYMVNFGRLMQSEPLVQSSNQCIKFDDVTNALISSHFDDEYDLIDPNILTLQQWIDESKPSDKSALPVYIRSAILIALKLTERLIFAGQSAGENPDANNRIPIAVIDARNVLVTVASEDLPTGSQITEEFNWDMSESSTELNKQEKEGSIVRKCILRVEFSPIVEINCVPDTTMSRLAALGCILYELVSIGERLSLHSISKEAFSLNAIQLNNDGNSDDGSELIEQRSKKSTPRPVDDRYSHLTMKLASIGIPHRLIDMVENLLNCSQGEFSGDYAYKSLDEVMVDLELMLNDPSRFLNSTSISDNLDLAISDELYGREKEIRKLRDVCERCLEGKSCGALILGEGGVGKSTLAMCTKLFTHDANGYFVSGKFDRNSTRPFMAIGDVFNSICDSFASDIQSPEQERTMAEALTRSLGNDACLLLDIVSNLSKLLPLHASCESSSVDAASRTRYLLLTLLDTLSKFSKPIIIFLDDLHWIDPASLSFCNALLQHTKNNKNLCFVFCSRYIEEKTADNINVNDWLQSLSESTLETIHLTNLNPEEVNRLVSGSLRTSPRLTRSLSTVLHSKSLGNPFFLRQTMEVLCKEGYFHFSLIERKWKWDLDEILDLRLDDNVVALLTRQMSKLPEDLLIGLKAASCIGNFIPYSIVGILSKHLGLDLDAIFRSLVQRSYLTDNDSTRFRFAHDRIHQAAYTMMSKKQQRDDHMKIGLAICRYVLEYNENDYDMMFIGVNQLNQGGPDALSDERQHFTIAQLNLKAGQRALALTDFPSAFSFFDHGIKFLRPDYWKIHYQLSLTLFSAAVESACALSDATHVTSFTEVVLKHSQCLEDRLAVLYFAVKSLKKAKRLLACRDGILRVLEQMGEDTFNVLATPPAEDIHNTNDLLTSTMTDDFFIHMCQCSQKSFIFLMRFYHELVYVYYVIDPTRIFGISLRMVVLTFQNGLTDTSSLAFAYYGMEVTAKGNLMIGNRLGTIALRLSENSKYISNVIAVVKQYISWVSEPFHAIAESNLVGFHAGNRIGDEFSSSLNYYLHTTTCFLCGKNLSVLKEVCSAEIVRLIENKHKWFVPSFSMLYWVIAELIDGSDFQSTNHNPLIPCEQSIVTIPANAMHGSLELFLDICKLMRSLFFRRDMDKCVSVLDRIMAACQLRPLTIIGVFFEGLISFEMARKASDSMKWISNGEIALTFMKKWESSKWNFENKIKLLEAERMRSLGFFDLATKLYQEAILSSEKHKFVHEHAISLEMQGLFFVSRKFNDDAKISLEKSVKFHKTWGANAVAKRIETYVTKHLTNGNSTES